MESNTLNSIETKTFGIKGIDFSILNVLMTFLYGMVFLPTIINYGENDKTMNKETVAFVSIM